MQIEALIAAKIAQRTNAGLSLTAHGAEGYTEAAPFRYHACDAFDFQRRVKQLQRAGFRVDAVLS